MNTSISILSHDIRQSENLFCINDLHKASGEELRHRPVEFLRLDQTKELIEEIVKGGDSHLLPVKVTKGRNGGTYACKELVYSYAMWISAKFHLHVIRAFDAMQMQAAKPALQLPPTLTPGQKCHIKAIIADKCKADSAAYQTIYTKLNNNFGVAKYDEILATNYPAACQLLGAQPLEGELLQASTEKQKPQVFRIDARACLLDGVNKPTIPLSDEVQKAIDAKAFSLAVETYELCRTHLAGRVAYRCERGVPRAIDTKEAIQVINEGDIGDALTQPYLSKLRNIEVLMNSAQRMATEFHGSISAALGNMQAFS